jgi:hypothetical protein
MQPKQRRRALILVTARVLLAWVVLLSAYFILPAGEDWNVGAFARLVIVVLALTFFVSWHARCIVRAQYPELRAMEALGAILVFFLVLFAGLYLAMSHNNASNFSQPIDHMNSLYFTVTVFSTVGFGDITAKTDAAQAVVSVQMVLDLVLIATVVRLLTTAAKTGLNRSSAQSST